MFVRKHDTKLHFLIQQLIRFSTDSICLQDMLGTHYGSLSKILVHEAQSILQHQNTSSQGNINRKTLTEFTRNLMNYNAIMVIVKISLAIILRLYEV